MPAFGGRSFGNRKEPSAVGRGGRGATKGFQVPAAHGVSVPSLLWVWLGLSAPAASVLVGVDDLHKPGRVEHVFALLPEPPLPHTRVALGAVAEPFGQPAGMLLPLVEEATDVGVIAGVGDRLVSPNRCSGRPS